MKILFANQFFPPDPAPTGVLLHEIATHLEARGHSVEFISGARGYRSSKKGSGRIRREMSALGRLFWAGIAAQRPDVVFSCSSPPCVLVAATAVAKFHRARSVHWAMDLYPDLAMVLGEIGPGVGRPIGALMGKAYRAASLVVSLDEDMSHRLSAHGVSAAAIRPWVPRELHGSSDGVHDSHFIWLYSGNLGRAHEWQTLLEVQAELERRGCPAVLRFQGGGACWLRSKAYAAELGLKYCEWHDYAPPGELRSTLLLASVLVATQRPETRGMLWPSKLATLMELRRPILFIGPEGAISRELRRIPSSGVFTPGDVSGIADWLEVQARGAVRADFTYCDQVSYRDEALQRWTEFIETL